MNELEEIKRKIETGKKKYQIEKEKADLEKKKADSEKKSQVVSQIMEQNKERIEQRKQVELKRQRTKMLIKLSSLAAMLMISIFIIHGVLAKYSKAREEAMKKYKSEDASESESIEAQTFAKAVIDEYKESGYKGIEQQLYPMEDEDTERISLLSKIANSSEVDFSSVKKYNKLKAVDVIGTHNNNTVVFHLVNYPTVDSYSLMRVDAKLTSSIE